MEAIRKGTAEHFQIAPDPKPASSRSRELAQYASEFHRRRTELIAAGKPLIALLNGGALVLHLVPLSAVSEQPAPSFDEITRQPHHFPALGSTHGQDFKITYDGLLIGSNAEGLTKPQRAYVHVFRSGVIEAAVSSLASGPEHKFIVLPEVQAMLVKFTKLYANSLLRFEIEPPMAIDVSLINVEGMKLLQDFIGTSVRENLLSGDLDRSILSFGQATFETAPDDYNESAKFLKPILMHLANTAGLHSPPYFDANGNYLGNLR
jgi:hypothetical protein